MAVPGKVRYKLPWPGLGSIPLFIIDNFDVVYSMENRLPPRLRHLNALRNQYIKLHTVLDLIDDNMGRVNANLILSQLISEFGLRSMRTIACYKASPFGQQVVVDQYLPLATLLALLVVYPAKTFDKFRCSLFEFLENCRDLPCLDCGFIRRNCKCDHNDHPLDETEGDAIGYAASYCDQNIQTEEMSNLTKLQKTVESIPDKNPLAEDKIITGPGGMKVIIPSNVKLDHGMRIPLTMSHDAAGPCLIPTTASMPTLPPPVPPNSYLPPMDYMGQPMFAPYMPRSQGPGVPQFIDPSILMPPPMTIPPMPVSGVNSMKMGKANPTGPDARMVSKPTGPPIGCIDVRIPEMSNPKYINTVVGTFKRVLPLRNVAIQVDTVVLPKKKNKVEAAVTHIFAGNKNISNGGQPLDVTRNTYSLLKKTFVTNISNPVDLTKDGEIMTASVVEQKNPDDITMADLDAETAKFMDEDTLEMLKRMEKADHLNKMVTAAPPPPKKVDKVWRIIDDDSDEETKDEEQAKAAPEGHAQQPEAPEPSTSESNMSSVRSSVEKELDETKDETPERDAKEKSMLRNDKPEKEELKTGAETAGDTSEEPVDVSMNNTSGAIDADESPHQMPLDSATVTAEGDVEKSSATVDSVKDTPPVTLGKDEDISSVDVEPANVTRTVDQEKSDTMDVTQVKDSLPSSSGEKLSNENSREAIDLEVAKVMTESLASAVVSPKLGISEGVDSIEDAGALMPTESAKPSSTDTPKITPVTAKKPARGDLSEYLETYATKVADEVEAADANSGDGMDTRPSSDTEEAPADDEEAVRRSLAAEVLGSLASFAPLVAPKESSQQQQAQPSGSVETASTKPPEEIGSVETASTKPPEEIGSVETASTKPPEEISSVETASTKPPEEIGSVETASTKPPEEIGDAEQTDVKETDVNEGEAENKPSKEDSTNEDDIDKKLVIDEGKVEAPDDNTKDAMPKKEDKTDDVTDLLPMSPTRGTVTLNRDGKKKYFAKFEHLPTGEKLYRCTFPTCSQCFDTRGAAKLHNQSHTVEESIRRLYCSECDYKVPFYMWFDLLRHLRETHETGLSEEPNSCMFCGLVFETPEKLVRHLEFHYSSRYKCVHCGIMVVSWGQVKLHMESCPEKEQKKVNFGCPFCMFVFHKRTIRNIHMLSHSDKGLTCALCDDESARWEHWKQLRKHYQSRHAKILTSKIGPFRSKLPMKKRNPKCRICSSEFKELEVFNNHMIKVHDLVPFTLYGCNSCEKTFRTRRRLDWHTKNAHQEQVACDECDFVANNKNVLRIHMSQKHGEQQHLCTECGKSFVYYHQLRVHMAHHARRIVHTCRTCGQEFTRSAELRKHVHEEHAEPGEKKAHYCTECDYWTYTKTTLVCHMQKKHSDYGDEDSDGPSAPSEITPASPGVSPSPTTMYPQVSPPYPRVNRPITTPRESSKQINRKKGKKRKRLTMQPRRQSISRSSKTSEVTVIKPAWDKGDTVGHLKPVRSREERKRHRQEEEELKKVKRLKRTSCARTRSVDEQKALQDDVEIENHEGITIPAKMQAMPGFKMPSYNKRARMNSREDTRGIHLAYPYLDHGYCTLEEQTEFVMPRHPSVAARYSRMDSYENSSSQDEGSSLDIVNTPSVSGFETCETSPTDHGDYRRRYARAKCSPGQSRAVRPGTLSDDHVPLSSAGCMPHNPKIQSPVQIRSLISKVLQASPTKTNRGKVSSLSQQLRSLAMEQLEIKDLDFPELIHEAGEILPGQDLITDILNSIDTFNMTPLVSNTSPKFGDTSYSSGPLPSTSRSVPQGAPPTIPDASLFSPELAAAQSTPKVHVESAMGNRQVIKIDPAKLSGEPQKPHGASTSMNTSFEDAILEGTPVGAINEGATDLDEIELKEADYQLWHDSLQPVSAEEPLAEFDDSLENAQIIVEFKEDEQMDEQLPPIVQSSGQGKVVMGNRVRVVEQPIIEIEEAEVPLSADERARTVAEQLVVGSQQEVTGPSDSRTKQTITIVGTNTSPRFVGTSGSENTQQAETERNSARKSAWLLDHPYF